MQEFKKNRITVEQNKPITEDMLKTNHNASECIIDSCKGTEKEFIRF